ncbi:hypothetical protein HDU81_001110, partial [Chytriomyces hyalinus]
MDASLLSDSDNESIMPALLQHLLQYAFARLKNGKFDVIQFVKHAKWKCPLEARALLDSLFVLGREECYRVKAPQKKKCMKQCLKQMLRTVL